MAFFYAVALLGSVYANNWQVFGAYLLNGNLFWLLILGFSTKHLLAIKITQLKQSFAFLYGLIIAAVSAASLLIFTPLSVFSIFTANTTDFMINLGRFFLLSGIALFLLEIPNALKIIGVKHEFAQSNSKLQSKVLFPLNLAMTFVSFYMAFAVIGYVSQNPASDTLANLILAVAMLLTGSISLGATVFKTWLK